jgi:hypothetical protein
MKKYVAIALTSLCALGMYSAAAAQAESRFYYGAGLGGYSAVSGTPRGSLSFSAAYTGGGWEYCVGYLTGAYEGINSVKSGVCGSGKSEVSSFGPTSGRAVVVNGYESQYVLAEERW